MTRIRVAHLGPEGSYGEEAAARARPAAARLACPSHVAVAQAVLRGEAQEGVLAVENSLEGSVAESVDLVVRDEALRARGEVVVPIAHVLVAPPGTSRLDAVQVVLSHPNALGQCRAFLDRALPGARVEPTLSTSAAVAAAMGRRGAAAIASERAASLHGARVLARDVADRPGNVTRFLLVGREDAPPTGRDKTSLAFTTRHDRPGTLVAVLDAFASRAINLTHVESRPTGAALGTYVFLVDLEGHRTEAAVAAALEEVRGRTETLRLMGSYPRADVPSLEAIGKANPKVISGGSEK